MTTGPPICRPTRVCGFRGDRSPGFGAAFLAQLLAEKKGLGPGPTLQQCLLYAGHAGVSSDGGRTVFGFNPDGSGVPVWQLMDGLRNGLRYPGIVRDDTAIFMAAASHGLTVIQFDVVLPDPDFLDFKNKLDAERTQSKYYYGFPNGDGDCNCITWLERLGLPLLTGRVQEFIIGSLQARIARRRFGLCV